MDVKTSIYRYCNYQDRCHQEVKNKLYELGAGTEEVNQLMSELIEVGLLNEERYAKAIASGRFRIKQWGKVKIAHHLKQNRVSDYCIKKALAQIDYDDYLETLTKLAHRKWQELKSERHPAIRKSKVYRYLTGKGYESSLISDTLKVLGDKK